MLSNDWRIHSAIKPKSAVKEVSDPSLNRCAALSPVMMEVAGWTIIVVAKWNATRRCGQQLAEGCV
jgi:hypothetical protein